MTPIQPQTKTSEIVSPVEVWNMSMKCFVRYELESISPILTYSNLSKNIQSKNYSGKESLTYDFITSWASLSPFWYVTYLMISHPIYVWTVKLRFRMVWPADRGSVQISPGEQYSISNCIKLLKERKVRSCMSLYSKSWFSGKQKKMRGAADQWARKNITKWNNISISKIMRRLNHLKVENIFVILLGNLYFSKFEWYQRKLKIWNAVKIRISLHKS